MLDYLPTEILGVNGRYRFVEFVLGHPLDAHGVLSVGDRAVSASGDLNERHVLIELAVVRLSLVVSEDKRVAPVIRNLKLNV